MQQMFAINVFSVFFAMKHQLPAMEQQNAGAILNVSLTRTC
jgi:short-subunit dehydrogenase